MIEAWVKNGFAWANMGGCCLLAVAKRLQCSFFLSVQFARLPEGRMGLGLNEESRVKRSEQHVRLEHLVSMNSPIH